ncbi:biotin-dependent carboxyltransferase family protein [Haloechinothrix sp. LS1_15]|uniref:5-oxoprolinase subunit C family protein n=1 Tax=Haloechinothrix sp. LS1_15 TaxID=2652248 RepID=UPI002946590F|nr:biotin-dependent carboxyltransferase family protein [Haloechinothrix sp. LS1_15]MDV6013961.1 biotin-dependent carboxyltransferase family protein [Haloechinothrix sp. LS1_15]
MIEILATGPLATIQDLGRPGLAELGVGVSGAADTRSFTLANRLVGNAESAAALELTLGGLAVRFTEHTVVAVTGAPCPLRLAGRAVDMCGPICVAPGQRLDIGTPSCGLRSYVAVRGGIGVEPVLGARATDQLSGLGPPPVTAGQALPVGNAVTGMPAVDHAPQPACHEEPELTVVAGPRHDWFLPEALELLGSVPFEVTPRSNRVGLRLHGPALHRSSAAELAPEPLVAGALQVPPDGQPILFLADHPVTGGYPVIGVVTAADLPLAAQARPGQRVRFRPSEPRGSRCA